MDAVKEWQNRPLESVYPILYLDAIRVRVREEGHIINKAVYIALGINMDGHKEILGLWIEKNVGAKFWLSVITELKNRGVNDIFIACVDGLKGFPDAINAVFPNTEVQLCIVHMIRNSCRFVSYKDRKAVATDLKEIYTAATVELAEQALDRFGDKWDEKYPAISPSWRNNWANLTPFFDYPKDIRKVIYTTNAIESINRSLRKVLKTKASFPKDAVFRKLMYLALQNASQKWTMPIRNWTGAINQFIIKYGDRVPV